MKLSNTLPVFLFWGMTLAAALPAAMPQATDPAPAEPTEPTSLSVDDDSGPELTSLSSFPAACPNCTSVQDIDNLRWPFTGWKAGYLRGNNDITFHSNGDIQLHYDFKNVAAAAPIKWALGCFVRDAFTGKPAHVFAFAAAGSLGPAGLGNHKVKFDGSRNEPLVEEYWQNIIAGDKTMHCEVRSNIDLGGIWELILSLISEYGPIIGSIITIF